MTQEWTELKTLQEVAAAQARGDEIEIDQKHSIGWGTWAGEFWDKNRLYRSRPRKKVKKIVYKLARLRDNFGGEYLLEATESAKDWPDFLGWLPNSPERIVEIEE